MYELRFVGREEFIKLKRFSRVWVFRCSRFRKLRVISSVTRFFRRFSSVLVVIVVFMRILVMRLVFSGRFFGNSIFFFWELRG